MGDSGESYTATGFNVSKPPPAVGAPFGNPDYPGVTTAGIGQVNWIDALVHDRAPANTLCYNFAWVGATVTRSPDDPPVGQYYTFTDQVAEFQQSKSSADWTGNNSLVITWFGVNDVALNTALGLPLKNSASSSNGYSGIVVPYFDQLNDLYEAGLRDFFVLDVPPIDRAPTATGKGEETVLNTRSNITAFNHVLRNSANAFTSAHAGSQISFLNTTTVFDSVLNSPVQYGAPNSSCWNSDGHTCLWSNDAHPATAIHQAVSEATYNQLNDIGFWKGRYDLQPTTSTASRKLLTNTTILLLIFATGFASGSFTSHRKPWTWKPNHALG